MLKCLGKVVATLLCTALALPALAQEREAGGIQWDVVPQSIEIASCQQSSPLLIIARNSTSRTASSLQITSFSDRPVRLSDTRAVKALAPGQQISWSANVTCTSDFAAGSLQLVFSDRLAGDGQPVTQIATKSISVKLREPPTLDSIASVDIKTTLESLKKGVPGEVLVTVTNKLVEPIQVTITPRAPQAPNATAQAPGVAQNASSTTPQTAAGATQPQSSITFYPQAGKAQVDPLRTELFSFTATANDRISPGKQLLIFQVAVSSTSSGSRDFVLTHEVNVGVLGESEVLTLLGVPSLLLLPGFLAVSSFLLLWRWKVLRPGGGDGVPLEETKSGFWLVSITVSLFISGGLLLYRKDFFSFLWAFRSCNLVDCLNPGRERNLHTLPVDRQFDRREAREGAATPARGTLSANNRQPDYDPAKTQAVWPAYGYQAGQTQDWVKGRRILTSQRGRSSLFEFGHAVDLEGATLTPQPGRSCRRN